MAPAASVATTACPTASRSRDWKCIFAWASESDHRVNGDWSAGRAMRSSPTGSGALWRGQKPSAPGGRNRFELRMGAQLVEDPLHVVPDGVQPKIEPGGDDVVGQPLRHQVEDLHLPRGEIRGDG